jgi:hypothetical protein
MGEVMGRAPVWPLALAWVRCGPELYLLQRSTLSCTSLSQFLILFLAVFLFPSVFSSYTVRARYSVFRYIRPICINALFLPDPFLPILI